MGSAALASIEMAKLACVCMLLVLGVHIGPGATSNVASQGSALEHTLVKRNVGGVKKSEKTSIKKRGGNKSKGKSKYVRNLKQSRIPKKKGKERTGYKKKKKKKKKKIIPKKKKKKKKKK